MSWDRVVTLDGPALVDRVAEATGVRLDYQGRCPGGQVGAAYVGWPDGRRSVLTWAPGVTRARVDEITAALDVAHAAGLPVPAYELVTELGDAIAIVQERLPGAVPAELDGPVLATMLAVHRRFAGLLAGTATAPGRLHLTTSGPGFCLHEPLAEYSSRTARLLRRIHAVGAEVPDMMPGDDLVHFDLHQQNVLVDADGRLTGIIDWDGAARGDSRFDLVTLRFSVPAERHDLAAVLDAELDARLGGDELRAYWASMSLRLVDWSIRHHTAVEVEHYLDLAESRLG